MQKATVGRTVMMVMRDGDVRPMIVTQAFEVTKDMADVEQQMVNGQVLLAGGNDLREREGEGSLNNVPEGLDVLAGTSTALGWSRHYSETKEPGTWHWPERV